LILIKSRNWIQNKGISRFLREKEPIENRREKDEGTTSNKNLNNGE